MNQDSLTDGLSTVATDALDNVISAFIILFILSVITEKFVSLVRRYPRQFRLLLALSIITFLYGLTPDKGLFLVVYLGCLAGIFTHYFTRRFSDPGTNVKAIERPLEMVSNILPHIRKGGDGVKSEAPPEVVEKEVLVLSFLIGCIIAFLFRADLIQIFTDGYIRTMSWVKGDQLLQFDTKLFKIQLYPEDLMKRIFSATTIGILLTGFFLSFGSKFFHDLLDTLLEVKNLKRKLNSKEARELDNVDDLTEFIKASNSEIFRTVYEENKELFQAANIRDVAFGTVQSGNGTRMAIHVYLADQNQAGLPSAIPYKLSSGTTIKIPIIYHLNVTEAVALAVRGDTIYPAGGSPDVSGSLGVVVKEKSTGKRYVMTCSHVINEGKSTSARGYVREDKKVSIIDSVDNSTIKESLYFDLRDGTHDIALVGELTNIYSNNLNGTVVNGSRAIRDEDIVSGTPVAFTGRITKNSRGLLTAKSLHAVRIKYKDASVEMRGLYQVAKDPGGLTSKFSQPGDSGSLVYDLKEHKALGIIVAGNSECTYIMPVQPFLDSLSLEIELI